MSGLPREVLKWMQSLDLSYSIRNTRQDLCNGYLIAEILSRYYNNDIDMHTYHNSTSMATKKDNWEQVEKVFIQLNIPIQRNEIDAVLHRQEGASIALICKIYSIVTGKTLQAPPPMDEDHVVPSYAQPTGSYLIKQKLTRDPAMVDVDDIKSSTLEATKILEGVKEAHRQERFQERLTNLSPQNSPNRSPTPNLSPLRRSRYNKKSPNASPNHSPMNKTSDYNNESAFFPSKIDNNNNNNNNEDVPSQQLSELAVSQSNNKSISSQQNKQNNNNNSHRKQVANKNNDINLDDSLPPPNVDLTRSLPRAKPKNVEPSKQDNKSFVKEVRIRKGKKPTETLIPPS